MSLPTLRRLVLACALLVLVVVVCSAYLRLAQSGLGCSEWPACYAMWSVETARDQPVAAQAWVRGTHRIAAMVLTVLLAFALLNGWTQLARRGARMLAVLAAAITAVLAWLGRITTVDAVPAVVIGNLAGGLLLVALLFALWMRLRPPDGRPDAVAPGRAARVAAGLLLVQVALGALLSARHAALACRGPAGCALAGSPDWRLFNPFVATTDAPAVSLAWLQIAHVSMALLATVAIFRVASLLIRGRVAQGGGAVPAARMLGVLVLLQVGLGLVTAMLDSPLWPALLHNLAGALLLSLLAAIAAGAGDWPPGLPDAMP